jgi:hypothetical protein
MHLGEVGLERESHRFLFTIGREEYVRANRRRWSARPAAASSEPCPERLTAPDTPPAS